MEDIMVCPFCCEEQVYVMVDGMAEDPEYFLICSRCFARGPEAPNKDEAIKFWNTAERRRWTKEEVDKIKQEAKEIADFLGIE